MSEMELLNDIKKIKRELDILKCFDVQNTTIVGLTDPTTAVGDMIYRGAVTSITNTISPTGNYQVSSLDQVEYILAGCNLTLADFTGAITATIDLWTSHHVGMSTSTVRLRRDNLIGGILESWDMTDGGIGGAVDGHRLHLTDSLVDAAPTTGHYVLTVQAVSGDLSIYSDTRGFTLSGTTNSGILRLPIGAAGEILTSVTDPVTGDEQPEWAAPAAQDHGALTGLTPDDDHTQYAKLAGRAGGQVLYGGDAANDGLTLEGTSHATRTTSFVLLNPDGGLTGVGDITTPTSYLQVMAKSGSTTTLLKLGGYAINQPFTTVEPDTRVAFRLGVGSTATGGGLFTGLSAAAGVSGIILRGFVGSASPTVSGVAFRSGKLSGTTGADMAATEPAYQFAGWDGSTRYMTILGSGNVGIDTVTPTAKVSVAEKCAMNPDGGFMVKLTNKTGGNSVKGEVVTCYAASAINNAVSLIIQDVPNPIGVFYESGIADGAEAWIVISGLADVYFVGNATRGHIARGFVAADAGYVIGQALSEAVPTSPFSVDKHFYEIGHVLESRTGAGLAKCVLHFN